MKNIIIACISLFFIQCVQAQCTLTEVPLAAKTAQATFIFEGKVIAKSAIWNEEKTKIYTRHLIEVYKKFKGNTGKQVYLFTPGGEIDGIGMRVTPSLQLQVGETGLFFSRELVNPEAGEILSLQPFASLQGFIHYDETKAQASDHFKKYTNIETQLYGSITSQLGKAYQEIKPLDKSLVEKQLIPVINSIAPLTVTAGTFQTITITGSGFGTHTGAATVRFRNPDFFGLSISYQSVPANHIVSWSDSQIEVIVPGRDIVSGTSGAGSGAIRVVGSDGVFAQSADDLTVLYNKMTLGLREVDLVNDNGNGGYTFSYQTDFFNNLPARAAATRAFTNWQCTTFTNFETANTPTPTTCPANDGINLMAFDTTCPLPTGLLAQSTQWYISCANGDAFFEEMDLIFDADAAWNFGPSATTSGFKDFQSIVTHELGHVQGMGHVLDYGKVMYPSLASATDIRTIDADAETCVASIIAHSSVNNSCGGSSAMLPLTSCAGVVVQIKALLEGAYNMASGNMNTILNDSDLVPLAQPYARPPWAYTGDEMVSSMSTNIVDWVLIEVWSEGLVLLESRAGLLRNDGLVMDIDGTEGLYFPSIIGNANYHLVVRHRNHLAIMSDLAVNLPNLTPYDFTDIDKVKGTQQVKQMGPNVYALRAGDFNSDGVITVADFNFYTTQVAQINLYLDGDCNLDKNVTVADFNFYQSNNSLIGVSEIRY